MCRDKSLKINKTVHFKISGNTEYVVPESSFDSEIITGLSIRAQDSTGTVKDYKGRSLVSRELLNQGFLRLKSKHGGREYRFPLCRFIGCCEPVKFEVGGPCDIEYDSITVLFPHDPTTLKNKDDDDVATAGEVIEMIFEVDDPRMHPVENKESCGCNKCHIARPAIEFI